TLAAPGVQWSGIWSVIRDPLWTVVYQAQIGAYAATAIGHLAWSLRRSTFASESTRNKLTAVLGVLLLGLAFWAVTNVYSAATGGSRRASGPRRGACARCGTGTTTSSSSGATS